MSVSVQVIAQTRLSDEDFGKVLMYNSLINDCNPPDDLKNDVRRIIGPSFDDGAPVPIPEELPGTLLDIAVIPPTTLAIRIYLD